MSKGKEFPQSEGCDRHWRFIPSCEDCFAPQPASENFPEPPVVEPAPPPASLGDEERVEAWADQFSEPKTHGPAARLVAKASALWGLRTSRAELLAEREKVRRMRGALEFYADAEKMFDMAHEGDGTVIGYVRGIDRFDSVESDFEIIPGTRSPHHGKRAREALKETE